MDHISTDSPPLLYQHTPLGHENSIRLLELFPGRPGTPLRCRVFEKVRTHTLGYEALSYTWGAPVFPDSISVDTGSGDCVFPITHNLFEALQALRWTRRSRLLWIDAICIDQSNTQEKGHQVTNMGNVFRDASSVTVWLGPVGGDLSEVLRLLDDISIWKNAESLRVSIDYWPRTCRLLTRIHASGLLQSSWFTRVWTVQEFVLARQIKFQFGPCQMAMSGNLHQILLWVSYSTGICLEQTQSEGLAGALVREMSASVKFPAGLFKIWAAVHRDNTSEPKIQVPRLTDCVIDMSRYRDCSDQRDQIYGMLGIANDLGIEADYNLSTTEVFSLFFGRSLASGDLSILHKCHLGVRSDPDPFFCKALTQADTEHFPFVPSLRRPASGRKYQAHTKMLNLSRLSITGVSVDRVVQVSQCQQYTDGSLVVPKFSCSVETASGRLCRILPRSLYSQDLVPFSSEPEGNAVALTLSCPPYRHETLFEAMSSTLQLNTASPYINSPEYTWKNLQKRLLAQYLFKTERGYLGLGSHHLRPGDLVVISDGDTTPFLIREDRDNNGIWTGRYNIVGDCYLHGWMGGNYFGHTIIDSPGESPGLLSMDFPDVAEDELGFYKYRYWYKERQRPYPWEGPDEEEKVLKRQTFIIC